jgi:hypothetical protein
MRPLQEIYYFTIPNTCLLDAAATLFVLGSVATVDGGGRVGDVDLP